MLIWDFVGFIIAIIFLVKSAEFAVKFISRFAKIMRFSEFFVSFFIVAIISTFPEFFVSVFSAINRIPAMGLGTLIGSNIADMSLILGFVALTSNAGIRIHSKTMKLNFFFFLLVILPVLLAFDGQISRADGLVLILGYLFFLFDLIRQRKFFHRIYADGFQTGLAIKSFVYFLISIGVLLLSSNFVLKFAKSLSIDLSFPPILVGLVIISLGTCLPELLFSIKSLKKEFDELGLGDILGNVVADATLAVGVTALIHPITFNFTFLIIGGIFLFLTTLFALYFIYTGDVLTKQEGVILIIMYFAFVVIALSLKAIDLSAAT